jgi:hypothetical protein
MRKNDTTIYILIAAGLGIYWYMRNKSTTQVNPADKPLIENVLTPTGYTGEGVFKDYIPNDQPLSETGFPPNTGGNFDMVYEPVGSGSKYMTDMFDSILDTSRNINKDKMYEK